jgi:hypothetical protein
MKETIKPDFFKTWAKEYEKKYAENGTSIQYRNAEHKKQEERSPYFESISRVLQKRGYLLREEFINICKWKTRRQTKRCKTNSDQDIKKITKTVISESQEIRNQIDSLKQLKGVGVPVASAILTVIFPNRYCVLDYRAWRALQWWQLKHVNFHKYSDFSKFLDDYNNYKSRDSYIKYWGHIRSLANKLKMKPRKIEMALWKYDKESGEQI